MADSNQNTRAQFFDDDPFAELTRIMGHDPRRPQEPEAAPSMTNADLSVVSSIEDDFGIDLEKELMGELDFAEFDEPAEEVAEAANWREAPVEEAAVSEQEAASWIEDLALEDELSAPEQAADAYQDDAPLWDDDLGAALERELLSSHQAIEDAVAAAPVTSEPTPEFQAEEWPAPAHALAVEAEAEAEIPVVAEPEPEAADVVFSFDAEEIAPQDEPEWDAWEIDPVAQADNGFVAGQTDDVPETVAPEHQPEYQQPAELSLEDELSALLADDEPAAAPSYEATPTAPEPVEDAWRPSVSTFGHSTYADLAAEEAEAVALADDEPVAYEAAPQHDDLGDIFGDDFVLDVEEPAQQPTPVFAAAAAFGGAAAAFTGASRPAAEAQETPDIETVEILEAASPLVDDLDIPELEYGSAAPASNPYDDLDGDFAQAFDDIPLAEAGPIDHAAYAQPQAGVAPEDISYAETEQQWLAAPPLSDDGFNHDTDLEQTMAMSSYEDERPEPQPRGRGKMIAAAVAGVVAVGALGVVGMSFFGGGSDGPALVRADTEPMKVRPENPGGTTVPNQDNEVYQRVAGGSTEVAPGQERLISTAEEPVDVTAQGEIPPALAPGIDGGAANESLADGGDDLAGLAGQLKSEDRLEPSAQDASGTTVAEEVAVVAPRRVRTMIVRPDGTLVPREDPAPVAQAPSEQAPSEQVPALAPAGAQPLTAPPSIETAATLSGDDEGGPTVETPETVSVVPSRRVEPQAQQPVAQPAPQQVAQAPAATPVSAPAAAAPAGEAAGGWSMQIASQPTAEGAQASYQDLARRYGSVLEGRGVNIVRADIDGRGTYYRVRIPAASRDEAIQLCTRYKAAGGSCFVSR